MKRSTKKPPRRAAFPVILQAVHGAMEPYANVIAECLHFCRTAADEARQHAREDGCTDEQVRRVMAGAYMANLPELTNVGSVQGYVACVAVAMSRGYVSGREARLLLYTAQLALAAMHKGVQR